MLEQIKVVMDSQEVNWQTVLSFLSTAVVCVPQFSDLIQGNHWREKIVYFLPELNLSKPAKVGSGKFSHAWRKFNYHILCVHKHKNRFTISVLMNF